ncbi:hypothetical protein Pla22_36350 [Rubripirellula amarantea]|uniref:Transmembrane protein n=1 Tax=Rubripirellula amarantea TaxID=2527999 RepID=A0A5C5WM75_9BACT|nr:hypothetical protein [Rubripirellula amarantea]TWT50892.1 hypothetical protein Pla22_36350 [Rubripirellula amarantea]
MDNTHDQSLAIDGVHLGWGEPKKGGEPKNGSPAIAIVCLRIGAFLCFAGWTWVHWYWESPLGVLLWQDSTLELAERFGLTWDDFVGTGADDGVIQQCMGNLWWAFLACCVMTITVRKRSWVQMIGLLLGSGLLGLLAYAAYVRSQYQLPMFIEHGGQMLSPILLVIAIALGASHRVTVLTAIAATVMTFAGHGCYAFGFWPTPGNFYAMTTLILEVDYSTSQTILRTAGILDFLVCIGICVPKVRRPFALYAAAWGFLTAIARPAAGMSWELNYWGSDQYVHEAVLRAPHFLIPLFLFFIWRRSRPSGEFDRLGATPNDQ